MKQSFYITCSMLLLFSCYSNLNSISYDYLYPIRTGEKEGYININGEIVVEPIYRYASDFRNDFAVVVGESGCGYMKKDGTLLTKLKFEGAYAFFEGLACVHINNKYGFINSTGKIVINPQFDEILGYGASDIEKNEYGFKEGLAAVCINKKWGYIDKTGKVVVEFHYDDCTDFRNGMSKVKKGDNWYYLKKEDFKIVNSNLWPIGNFSSNNIKGVAVASVDDRYVLVNKNGAIITNISSNYEIISWHFNFYNNLLLIQDKNTKKYGYLDTTGNLKIKPIFEEATIFQNDVAAVKIDDKYGCIDTDGNTIFVLDKKYSMPIGVWHNYLEIGEGLIIIVKEDDMQHMEGFVNLQGKIMIEPQFAAVGLFNHGLAVVYIGELGTDLKQGYINKKGEFVWGPTY